jgi:hypothetical protein
MMHRFFLRTTFILIIFFGLYSSKIAAQSYFFSGIPELSDYRSSSVFPHPSGFLLALAYDSAGIPKNSIMLFNDDGAVIWHKRSVSTNPIIPKSVFFFVD